MQKKKKKQTSQRETKIVPLEFRLKVFASFFCILWLSVVYFKKISAKLKLKLNLFFFPQIILLTQS